MVLAERVIELELLDQCELWKAGLLVLKQRSWLRVWRVSTTFTSITATNNTRVGDRHTQLLTHKQTPHMPKSEHERSNVNRSIAK